MILKHHLGIADYSIILASLAISSLIGIGFRFSGDRQKTTNEYLLAGKNSHMLPVIMSSSVTTISAIAILGMPAEVYKYGFTITVVVIGICIGMLIAAYLFIPVYFRCEVSSIYEYLEMRFGRYTRYTVSAMFMIQMFLYMSVVLFAPVLALSAVTDISMEISIILFGTVCTFYCFLGGLKAVMWTDVLQSFLMFVCVGMIICVGIYEIGGIGEIFNRASATNRLDIDLRFDYTTRFSLWNCLVGGLLIGIGMFGSNQVQVQRILCLSGLKRARKSMLWSIIPVCCLYTMMFLSGIIIYSIFYLCDPVLMQQETGISTYDQLVPYFIITRLSSIPGLTGLCIAGIFSGSLSTMSSALNSMSTVAVIDFLKPNLKTTMKDSTLVLIAKGFSLLFGILSILLTFVIASVESITHATSVFLNTVEGPVIAIFSIGLFTRKVSDKCAVLGLLISLSVLCWISFGSMISGYTEPTLPLETSGCHTAINNTVDTFNSTSKTTSQDENGDVIFLYKMSFVWVPIFGYILTSCTALLISLVIDRNKDMILTDSKCLSPITRFWMKPDPHSLNLHEDKNAQIEEHLF